MGSSAQQLSKEKKNESKKVNKTTMTTTMTMSQTMKMKVVHNWHRITAMKCVTVVEKKVTVHQIVQ